MQLAGVISDACVLLCITLGLLLEGGHQLGWIHGPSGYAIAGGDFVILLAVAAYWLFGERRLRTVLERRAEGIDGMCLLAEGHDVDKLRCW